MTASIIDGKMFAENLKEEIARKVETLKINHNLTPGLAVVLVGTDPASQVYVRNKNKSTNAAGMNSFEYLMDDNVSEEDLIAKVKELNKDPIVHGILVQLPLPKHINEAAVIETITPEKDVDGFHVINSGLLATGGKGMVPCTPQGCIMMLKNHLGNLSGLDAVVVGRSNIVGKPMAQLLLNESCTVTIAHSRTKNLKELCLSADILIVAIGKTEFVTADMVKQGAVVIDVGQTRVPDATKKNGFRNVGDVDFDKVKDKCSYITYVTGGVGPMTRASLLQNTLKAHQAR